MKTIGVEIWIDCRQCDAMNAYSTLWFVYATYNHRYSEKKWQMTFEKKEEAQAYAKALEAMVAKMMEGIFNDRGMREVWETFIRHLEEKE